MAQIGVPTLCHRPEMERVASCTAAAMPDQRRKRSLAVHDNSTGLRVWGYFVFGFMVKNSSCLLVFDGRRVGQQ